MTMETAPITTVKMAPAPHGSGELTIEELASQLPEHLDMRDTLTRLERTLIVRALNGSDGVQAEPARRLGVSRSDLGYKVGKYSIGGSPDLDRERSST
jgi:transcriptional regulator with GAF, ATPase, and Fis domain